jgi:hypothetical protein
MQRTCYGLRERGNICRSGKCQEAQPLTLSLFRHDSGPSRRVLSARLIPRRITVRNSALLNFAVQLVFHAVRASVVRVA